MRRVANYVPPWLGCTAWCGVRGLRIWRARGQSCQSKSMLSSIVNRRQSASIQCHIILNCLNHNPIAFKPKHQRGHCSPIMSNCQSVNRAQSMKSNISYNYNESALIIHYTAGGIVAIRSLLSKIVIYLLNYFFHFNLSKKCIDLSIFSKLLSYTQ